MRHRRRSKTRAVRCRRGARASARRDKARTERSLRGSKRLDIGARPTRRIVRSCGRVDDQARSGSEARAHAVLVKAKAEICAGVVRAQRAGEMRELGLRGECGALELRMREFDVV